MLTMILLLIAQSAPAPEPKQAIEAALTASRNVSNQMFACMDKGVKAEMVAQYSTASAPSVVDAALASCAHLKRDYAAAVTDGYISPASAQELADKWSSSLREAYVKHVDQMLLKPEISAHRAKIVTMEWTECVRGKAKDWSRLNEEAATVGRAAVTACREHVTNLRAALEYDARSRKLPVDRVGELAGSLQSRMEEIAIEVVISERANRLPKQ